MDLSIVVVNWNTRDLLVGCLEAVARSTGVRLSSEGSGWIETEVVVVDNASSDLSGRAVRDRVPWARLILNQHNVGFARANNQAIPLTSGSYVLLLNPDTIVEPHAIETLVGCMARHPEAGAAGPRLLDGSGTQQSSCQPAPTLLREAWRLFHLDALHPVAAYAMEAWDTAAIRRVEVVQGACMILRRSALDQTGLLDDDYFMYSEEVDLCTRLRERGWNIYWVPQASVVHFGGQSTHQVAASMFLHLYRGKILYFRKHRGRTAARVYKLIVLLAALARLAVSPCAWLESPCYRQRHLRSASSYWRLVKALPQL